MGTAVETGVATVASQPRAARPAHRRERAVWFLALCAALVISRWLIAPRYLITFDEINFALAIDHFNPMLHQPQPPGYPLFVVVLKMVSLVVSKIETVFLIAGLVMSVAALVLVWWCGELIVGARRGLFCALLLLFNPAFWLAAFTNPVRLCNAVGASAVALCVWRACHGDVRRWLPLAAAALGFFAGFRQELVILLAPLILWAAFRKRVRWTVLVVSLLSFGAAVGLWLPGLIIAVGGWRQGLTVLRGYSNAQFAGTSLLFGAPLGAALHMAWEAIVWSCLGALSWVWAAPLVLRKPHRSLNPLTLRFLAWWFFPGLLFYAIVHVGDPDHTLSIVPATCVAGAVVLSTLTRRVSRFKTVLVISVCVLLNIFLFLKPIGKTAKASTIVPVRWTERFIANMIDGLRAQHGRGPLTVVFDDWTGAWRHLAQYDPGVHIVVIERGSGRASATRHIVGDRSAAVPINSDAGVGLPACGTVAWVDPVTRPVARGGSALDGYPSVVYSAAAVSGETFDFSGVRFVAGEEPCSGAAP